MRHSDQNSESDLNPLQFREELNDAIADSLHQPQLFHLGVRLICAPRLMNKSDVKY